MKEEQNIIVGNLTDRQLALILATQKHDGFADDVIKLADYFYDWLTKNKETT